MSCEIEHISSSLDTVNQHQSSCAEAEGTDTTHPELKLCHSPLRVTEMMPGTRPPNMLLMEVAGVFSVATSTPVMAPVTLIFFCTLPDAVITTSSITFELSFNTTRRALVALVADFYLLRMIPHIDDQRMPPACI